ncbi:MAG: 2-hydroxy-3-oxopropionate reductase [Chloroflexi bacterium]|nr:2-hydroxy-3-oxopropionate reductase [Chloroflexota bacterium]
MPRERETVGFIGLGLMGKPMAKNLLKAGFALVVHSRSSAPITEVVAAGAQAASSPAEVAQRADVIITMLPDSPDVQAVIAGPRGVFEGLRAGSVIVDMSTIAPTAATELAAQAAVRGASMLDAPVSGGEVGAINATLSIMVGGHPDVLERVRPILSAMGSRIIHIGGAGAGQLCKVCNQLVIGATLAGVSEALALATKAGVDPARVREALLGGFAASRVLEVHGERIIQKNFKPGFRARMYQKDMRIVLDTARAYDLPMPVSALVQQLVNALMAAGHGPDDYSSLATVLFEMAGLKT